MPAAVKTRVWLAVPLVTALLLAAASAAPPSGGAARSNPRANQVVVGALLDLTSGWTSLGRASRVALGIAAANANSQLAKQGSQLRIRLRVVDVRGKPDLAVQELRRLAAAGVRIFIGPESSAEVKAVRSTADRLGVVVVSQGSTAHSLARRGDNVFRLVPDDRREGEALVALLSRDRIRAVAPIWRADPGNAGLVTSVRGRFQGLISRGVPYGVDETDFSSRVAALHAQVAAFQARHVTTAVYLAGFDEIVDLFHAAAGDPVLSSVAWYGSDGVALTSRLIKDRPAAAFAAARGYPNPTLGLDTNATRRSAGLRARIRAKLGSQPDAFALTSYDALRIAAQAAARAGSTGGIARFKRQFATIAHGYDGVTGTIVLNAAGDRAYGSFDFWSVCRGGSAFAWHRTSSYLASGVGRGHIVRRAACHR